MSKKTEWCPSEINDIISPLEIGDGEIQALCYTPTQYLEWDEGAYTAKDMIEALERMKAGIDKAIREIKEAS